MDIQCMDIQCMDIQCEKYELVGETTIRTAIVVTMATIYITFEYVGSKSGEGRMFPGSGSSLELTGCVFGTTSLYICAIYQTNIISGTDPTGARSFAEVCY